ncbi:MAG: P-loop NTPase [Candidatus Brocadiaceae bacterium]|nr:P-loop NTPase [Candidatus Brocadiaceae bacterium]
MSDHHIPLQQDAHLIDYLNVIRKRKWVVIIFFLTVVATVNVGSFFTTPVYKATTQLIIENNDSLLNEMADVSKVNMNSDVQNKSYYQTQYKLLMSRSLAKSVIDELELWKDCNLEDYRSVKEQDAPHGNSSGQPEMRNDPRIIKWYLKNLEISPLRETHLVDISFLHSSPEKAALIANTHARAFIERNNHIQQLASRQSLDWFKEQLFAQKMKVGTSQKEAYEYKYKQLRSFTIDDESIFSIPEVEQNVIIQNLHDQLGKQKAERSILATRYGPKHHKIIEIDNSIGKLEQGIIHEIQSIRKAIRTELNRIAAIEKINQQNRHVPQDIVKPQTEKAINYDTVRLEAESDKAIYDILLTQAKEINLTGNMERSNIRVVDAAETPTSTAKPRILLNAFLSIVVGLTFGVGLAFFLEYMDKTIRTPEDITKHLGLSALGVIPYDRSLADGKIVALPADEDRHNRLKPAHGGYAPYDVSGGLIARLPLTQSGMLGRVYLVESTTKGEGKTTVLAKLAVNLAKGGLRVVMVDADLYHPSLHHVFGIEDGEERGLLNAMEGALSQNIKQGNLKDYSVDDLFSIIALKRLSGQLVIKNDTLGMTALFENGRLFHIQSKDIPPNNRLGAMLLHGGFITGDQLKDALERNQRTGFPLGYILINAGYVNQEQLKGPLKLQMEEHLQKLFSWKHGAFTFEPGSLEIYEDKKIYFEEDYTPVASRLGHTAGSRLLKREVFSHVQQVNGPNLSLLPVGAGHVNLESPIYFGLLSKFLHLLKQQYDVVLVDAPPLMEAMNAAMPLLNFADGVIWVIKSGHVSIDAVKRVITGMQENKAKILGAVLNQAKTEGYYYYYA